MNEVMWEVIQADEHTKHAAERRAREREEQAVRDIVEGREPTPGSAPWQGPPATLPAAPARKGKRRRRHLAPDGTLYTFDDVPEEALVGAAALWSLTQGYYTPAQATLARYLVSRWIWGNQVGERGALAIGLLRPVWACSPLDCLE